MDKLNKKIISVNDIYFSIFGPTVGILLDSKNLEEYKETLKNNSFDVTKLSNITISDKTKWTDAIILGDIHQVVIGKVQNGIKFQNIK